MQSPIFSAASFKLIVGCHLWTNAGNICSPGCIKCYSHPLRILASFSNKTFEGLVLQFIYDNILFHSAQQHSAVSQESLKTGSLLSLQLAQNQPNLLQCTHVLRRPCSCLVHYLLLAATHHPLQVGTITCPSQMPNQTRHEMAPVDNTRMSMGDG